MRYARRAALGVPVLPVGCPLTCTFCATGTMRFGRNLTAFEILDQALHFRREDRSTTRCSWAWASR